LQNASAAAPVQKRTSTKKKKTAPAISVPKHQRDFIPWRLAFTNEGERDPELDSCFWHPEQEALYKDFYCNLGKHKVCPMQYIDFAHLERQQSYFGGAIAVVDALGLRALMEIPCNYSIHMVHQFYATVVFDKTPARGMTWMSGNQKLSANFHDFADALEFDGHRYGFSRNNKASGKRMHIQGAAYDKNEMRDLYDDNGLIGSTKGLLPTYDILLRMFRHSIAPSGGNNDEIRGGLVNLMVYAHEVLMEDDPEPNSFPIDVMDFIFNEMYDAVMGRKVPPYAPYIMRLIKAKFQFGDHDVLNLDEALGCDVIHKPVQMHKKNAHLSSKRDKGPMVNDDGASGSHIPSDPRVKKPGFPKQRPWAQRALSKVLAMNVCIHKENYQASVERHQGLLNDYKIMQHLKVKNCPPPPPPHVAYKYWNNRTVDWNTSVPDDVDREDDSTDDDE